MKTSFLITVGVVAIAASLAAGYWWGQKQSVSAAGGVVVAADSKNGDSAIATGAGGSAGQRRILYYRNPMGLPDTSPVPKKDQMGMDYIAVYAEDEPASATPLVKLSVDKVQKLGVKTEAVARRDLSSTIRAVATVQANERKLHTVTPRFDGWIERLYVNTTGQVVKKGEALMTVYSPDLIAAQQEYLIARRGVETLGGAGAEVQASMQRLVDSALQRLRNWEVSDAELQSLTQRGSAAQNLTLRSPANGVIMEKPAIQGKRFMAGEVLYQVADLSQVWLIAEVFERDLGQLRLGQAANIRVDAYPDKTFGGKVTFIYPTVTPESRTAKVRVELANPQGLLKPSMYAQAEFLAGRGKGPVLTVPDSAVLDTGTRQMVLVERAEGRFEPRQVKLGARGDGYAQVLQGVKEGERVVVSANFLIDAESNLKAAFSAFGQGAAADGQATPGATGKLETHGGKGRVVAVDAAQSSLTLRHEPIASLKWPAMTMDFKVKDAALLRALRPGQDVAFDMQGEAGGEYTIVNLQAAAGQSASVPPPGEAKPSIKSVLGLEPNSGAPAPADAHRGH